MTSSTDCRLYLITPPRLDAAAFSLLLADALDAGDVAAVQLRLKDADDDAIRLACDVLRPVVQSRDVAFILNDRPDLALACDCDGVHVGQQDTPYAEARRLLGADAIVGVTCHDFRHLAMEAAEAGASYVAFGAFFATATKEPPSHTEPEILAWWSSLMTCRASPSAASPWPTQHPWSRPAPISSPSAPVSGSTRRDRQRPSGRSTRSSGRTGAGDRRSGKAAAEPELRLPWRRCQDVLQRLADLSP